MRMRRHTCLAALPPSSVRRLRQLGKTAPLAGTDNEQPRPSLRHSKVCGMEDLPPECVPGCVDLRQEAPERRPARLVVVGERVDVLEDEGSWLGFCQNPCVRLEETGVRVQAGALPVEPEPRFRERRTGRATDEEVG